MSKRVDREASNRVQAFDACSEGKARRRVARSAHCSHLLHRIDKVANLVVRLDLLHRRPRLNALIPDRILPATAHKMEPMDRVLAVQHLIANHIIHAIISEPAHRTESVRLAEVLATQDAHRRHGADGPGGLDHALRVLGRSGVLAVGAAVPDLGAVVDVAVVVAARQHDGEGALTGRAEDAALRGAVCAVAQRAELRWPPLAVDEVAGAVIGGGEAAGKLRVDAVGVALGLVFELRYGDAAQQVDGEDAETPAGVELLGIRADVPGKFPRGVVGGEDLWEAGVPLENVRFA